MVVMRENDVETFLATTWNVYFGTDVDELESHLDVELRAGVTLFLMQEAQGGDIDRMLKRNGLDTVAFGEYRIAWDPTVWELLGSKSRRVSATKLLRGKNLVEVFLIVARLRHIPTGKKVKAISYHTPSHVQRPEWNRNAPNRWQIFKDAMYLLKEIAANSLTRHIIAGGDDNADETKASGGSLSRWRFALSTGLNQIQAPEPTHDTRAIDDFRVKGLVAIGRGVVSRGGGDHKKFRMKFGFKNKRR